MDIGPEVKRAGAMACDVMSLGELRRAGEQREKKRCGGVGVKNASWIINETRAVNFEGYSWPDECMASVIYCLMSFNFSWNV